MKGGMLLSPLRDIVDTHGNETSWTEGVSFSKSPDLPVIAKIRSGYETADPRPFLGVPPIISNELNRVLQKMGVKNIETFDAVLKSTDGQIIEGYKAFNLVGLVSYADVSKTNLQMFRIEENTSAIFVHEKVRAGIESAKIPFINFLEPTEEEI